MKRIKEFSYIKLPENPPKYLKWAFRKVGKNVYQIRGAGKIFDYEVLPRWGWEVIYEMLKRVYNIKGFGGFDGVKDEIKGVFLRLYGEFVKNVKGYTITENKRGVGRVMLEKYKIYRVFEIPAKKHSLGLPEDVLYLNYILHLLGFEVDEYMKVQPEFFKVKYLQDSENKKLWLLAYLISIGVFGYGYSGFLINTPLLFEEFVGEVYGGKRYKGDKLIKPDYILEDNTPLDAKYKTKVQRLDVYQAFTYAKVLGVNRAILVYPKIKPKVITLGDVSVFVEGVFS
ncbi:MAG: hypothetical protein ABIL51_07605 [candidate division WOR-3 bacterium]